MSEITGKIEAKSQYGIKIDEEWYNTKDEETMLLVEKGDKVTVTYEDNIGKNGKVYHNMTTVKECTPTTDGTITEEIINEGKSRSGTFRTAPTTITKDRLIVRQNALAHADAAMARKPEMDKEDYFAFAQECEEWVMRTDG